MQIDKNNFNKNDEESGFVVDLNTQILEHKKKENKKVFNFLNKFCTNLRKCNPRLNIKNILSKLLKTISRLIRSFKKIFSKPIRLSDFLVFNYRSAVYLAITLFLLILPFKALTYYFSLNDLKVKVLGTSGLAVGELFKAGESASGMNFSNASENFSNAADNFFKAQNDLKDINNFFLSLISLSSNENLKLASDAKVILSIGQKASEVGEELSLAATSLLGNNEYLMERLEGFIIHGNIALNHSKELSEILEEVNVDNLPEEYREKFALIRENSEFLSGNMNELVDLISRIKIFLGEGGDKRYLLIFQNNTEMRGSGGFVGSFALVDFNNGKIKNIEVPAGGSYDTEAGLYTAVASPEPLRLVNPLWHFWDANWWPDWQKSAKKLAWFYEKSNGPTVDGVISFTPTVIENILDIIGPIDMPEYDVVISSENFWNITQEVVERKPEIATTTEEKIKHEPKKIIGDLLEKIIEELKSDLDKNKLIDLAGVTENSLSEKHILFYFFNEELQNKVSDLNWDGRVKQTDNDYLMVVNTNIAGGKSDKKIKETISHSAEIMEDGSIINTVEIKREHTASKEDLFSGVRNVNWIRVYVPIGSELLEASGFEKPDDIYFSNPEDEWLSDPDLFAEQNTYKIHQPSGVKIYEDSWKTVFANWTMVDPGETDIIYLKYKLPFRIEKNEESNDLVGKIKEYFSSDKRQLYTYSLLAQKQPGSLGSKFISKLKLPNNFKTIWNYPRESDVSDDGWDVSDNLSVDKYWATLLEIGD